MDRLLPRSRASPDPCSGRGRVGITRPFLYVPSDHPRLKDHTGATQAQQREAQEIEALQDSTAEIEGLGPCTNRMMRLCTDPKGYPLPMMYEMIRTLPARDILRLEQVSRHRRLEIGAIERIKYKYIAKPPA